MDALSEYSWRNRFSGIETKRYEQMYFSQKEILIWNVKHFIVEGPLKPKTKRAVSYEDVWALLKQIILMGDDISSWIKRRQAVPVP